MLEQTRIMDIEDLVREVTGVQIVGAQHDGPDGMHFELSDWRYLIFTGRFIVGLCNVSRETIQ